MLKYKQMKIHLLFLCLLFCTASGKTQNSKVLTIEDCYMLSRQNYPLIKQRELILKSKEYSIENAGKAYFPQLAINGQASYQSDVTSLPIRLPGVEVPTLSKDQYKLYAEVNQPLYDGGMVKQQKRVQEANAVVEEQKLETELYKLKERINQLFFGILLIDEQLKLTELVRKDLQNGIKKTEAAIVNGVAFKTNADVLKAELLKINQRTMELQANRKAYTDMLGMYLNQSLEDATMFVKPSHLAPSSTVNRPELRVFESQSKNLSIQHDILKAKNLPRFNLFLQAGYGRPALNMLSNSFESYYIGGLRMSWSLSGLYTLKKDKALLEITGRNIDIQKELFLFNTGFNLKQQNAEIVKLQQLLLSDDEIISLRSGIKNTANVQLENGVINTSDYLREVNAEDQARENKLVHEIQLLLAQYTQQTLVGG